MSASPVGTSEGSFSLIPFEFNNRNDLQLVGCGQPLLGQVTIREEQFKFINVPNFTSGLEPIGNLLQLASTRAQGTRLNATVTHILVEYLPLLGNFQSIAEQAVQTCLAALRNSKEIFAVITEVDGLAVCRTLIEANRQAAANMAEIIQVPDETIIPSQASTITSKVGAIADAAASNIQAPSTATASTQPAPGMPLSIQDTDTILTQLKQAVTALEDHAKALAPIQEELQNKLAKPAGQQDVAAVDEATKARIQTEIDALTQERDRLQKSYNAAQEKLKQVRAIAVQATQQTKAREPATTKIRQEFQQQNLKMRDLVVRVYVEARADLEIQQPVEMKQPIEDSPLSNGTVEALKLVVATLSHLQVTLDNARLFWERVAIGFETLGRTTTELARFAGSAKPIVQRMFLEKLEDTSFQWLALGRISDATHHAITNIRSDFGKITSESSRHREAPETLEARIAAELQARAIAPQDCLQKHGETRP